MPGRTTWYVLVALFGVSGVLAFVARGTRDSTAAEERDAAVVTHREERDDFERGAATAARDEEHGSPVLDVASLRPCDVDGHPVPLLDDMARGVGIVHLSTECPISRRYLPEIARLAGESSQRGVTVVGVVSDSSTSRAAVRAWQKEFAVTFPVVFDESGGLRDRLAPTHAPESFVFDRNGGLVYRGRIDDLYGRVGRSRQRATRHEFADALLAVAEGRTPAVAYRRPVGCPVESRTAIRTDAVTYCREVAPILYRNCVACHREGEVAPFPLLSYQDAAKRAEWIAEVARTGLMPPWSPVASFGHFRDERRLTVAEVETLARWAEAGAPRGDDADLPPVPTFPTDWPLGEPDLVVRMPTAVDVPADGPDVFRFVPIPLELPGDVHLEAIAFRPGNRRVVHHAILATIPGELVEHLPEDGAMPDLDPTRGGLPGMLKLARLAERSGSVGAGFGPLGGWVPGSRPYRLPEGMGMPLSANATLLVQLHYAPSGRPETDRSEVALYFRSEPVERTVSGFALARFDLDIPPGEPSHRVESSYELPTDVSVLGIAPHMHLLGRRMQVTATRPDGSVAQLVRIDDWDWNWQGEYQLHEPVDLPRGTRLDLVAVYDNSTDNPANPHSPPARVRFGRRTSDEMCLCFLKVAVDDPEDARLLRRVVLGQLATQLGDRLIRLLPGG